MTNVLRRMELLYRMRDDGLPLSLIMEHPENLLEHACGRVEAYGLRERIQAIPHGNRLLSSLVGDDQMASLYAAMCERKIDDSAVEAMLASAEAEHETLTQYPAENVVAAASLPLHKEQMFDYLKYFLPYISHEEDRLTVVNNLKDFPVRSWESLHSWTEEQRALFYLPFFSRYLYNWYGTCRMGAELLAQNPPLQKIFAMLARLDVDMPLDADRAKKLSWLQEKDVPKFERLLELFAYDSEDLANLMQRWSEDDMAQYDINWFLSLEEPLPKERRHEIVYSELSYRNALYSGCLHLDFEMVAPYQSRLLIYAVDHDKKHFLELVDTHSALYLALGRSALLFEDGFREHCNLNSLTAKHLTACAASGEKESHFEYLDDGRQYTFEELHTLWGAHENYVRLYGKLTPLPVDQRLLTIRQLIKRNLLNRRTGEPELEQLAKCLLQRPFSQWFQVTLGHIKGLTRQTAMLLLQNYAEVQTYIPDLQTEADAAFVAANLSVVRGYPTWREARENVLTLDTNWQRIKEELKFPDSFVAENRDRITDFLLLGGSGMVYPLHDYLRYQDAAEENLRRIVQAELMGKFYELKYFEGDLQREIQFPIQTEQETAWKENRSLTKGRFHVEEVDDFFHTIQLGELPHRTCLSYRTGSYRECLLAAFDSNKKILLVKNGEKTVARACLRLTKGSFQKPKPNQFSFADLTNRAEHGSHQELLVLFLEQIYASGLNQEDFETVKRIAVELVTRKAESLNACAILADCYRDCYPEGRYVNMPFFMYISKSKNGRQYLDSLGGAAVTSHDEKYSEQVFLVEQGMTQENFAGM